jgi:hypothetical protein
VEEILRPLSEVTFEAGHCPTCGVLRESTLTHIIAGEEKFLHRTLASVGVPPLHIVKAQNGVQYRFYELTGDLQDTLHFRHFEAARGTAVAGREEGARVRLKEAVKRDKREARPGAHGAAVAQARG